MANNPLFNVLNGSVNNSTLPMNNFSNMINQFKQFKNAFKGNPKQQVQQLLSSGKMSNEQFEQLKGMAQQFKDLLK